jgi:uncharacterized phiE125 gp8 family phage protein
MSMAMTTAPTVEPVTLAEAKAQLRVDGTAEDAFLTSLIITSRLQIEAALGLALVTQRWRMTLDDWPGTGEIELPVRPVQSVESIAIAAGGSVVTLDAGSYHLDGLGQRPRIVLVDIAPPPPETVADGIAIELTAGFGASATDVPAPIRQALLLLVAHWYENREPATQSAGTSGIPDAVSALLTPYRQVRL